AEREHRRARQLAAGEEVVQSEQAAAVLLVREPVEQRLRVDARRGHVRADAIHQQAQEREQDLVFELGGPEQVLDRGCCVGLGHVGYWLLAIGHWLSLAVWR